MGVSVDGDVFNVLVDGFVIRCLEISSEPERTGFFSGDSGISQINAPTI